MNRRWLIVNGPARTGSTALYNALRLAAEAEGGEGLGLVEPWVVPKLIRVAPDRPAVLKVHGWSGVGLPTAVTISSVRHPLDVAASARRHPEFEGRPTRELLERAWLEISAPADFRVEYEKLRESPEICLATLMVAVGLRVPGESMREILTAIEPSAVREAALLLPPGHADPVTEIRHKHVSDTLGLPGAWRYVLSPEDACRLASLVPEWFSRFNYERPPVEEAA